MHESPRIRRLRNDSAALERLRSESSVFHFQAVGNPPHHYQITFKGKGLWRDRGKIKFIHTHRVEIKLGASYPRTIPEIRWLTPIYHPNISEIGMVCLGGYGTHWVPSVQLDELCTMLWDMARYHNYDIRSPYNRDAALWVANQTGFLFPTDPRSVRDLRVAQGRIESTGGNDTADDANRGGRGKAGDGRRRLVGGTLGSAVVQVRQFLGRYGRAFGEDSEAAANGSLATAIPNPTPRGDTATSAPSEEIPIAPAPPAVMPLVGQAEPRQHEEEVVILEADGAASTGPAFPGGSSPRGEDIVFID